MRTKSYTQLYVQIVFSTRNRINSISPEWEHLLFEYISGIINKKNCKSIIINGTENHIHILLSLNPTIKISDMVKTIKQSSTKFVNQNIRPLTPLQWQEGYGAFTYAHSAIENVYKYIQNQKIHHQKMSFKDEYQNFLNKFEIEYEPRRVTS